MLCPSFTMQVLLGFFFFSVIVTTGASLECETCTAPNKTCTGNKEACEAGQDACAITLIETIGGGQTSYNIIKGCDEKSRCNKEDKDNVDGGGSITTTVLCSNVPPPNAPSSSAVFHPPAPSILLALSGLLLGDILL